MAVATTAVATMAVATTAAHSALALADGAVLVEWADRADGFLPTDRWDIRLDFLADATRRQVVLRACGRVPRLPEPQPAEEDPSC